MNILIRELEELAATAFPALECKTYDGWKLRCSAGYTYRGNCVLPLSCGKKTIGEKVQFCEQWFALYKLPCVFKATKLAPVELLTILRERDYKLVKTVNCLYKIITDMQLEHFSPYEIEIFNQFNSKWFENILQFTPLESSHNIKIWQDILKNINKPVIYLQAKAGMKYIGGCMGVVDNGYIGLFSLHVDKNYQRQGVATKLCKALLSVACEKSAHTAYLQVANNNFEAMSFYKKFGFEQGYQYQFLEKRQFDSIKIAD